MGPGTRLHVLICTSVTFYHAPRRFLSSRTCHTDHRPASVNQTTAISQRHASANPSTTVSLEQFDDEGPRRAHSYHSGWLGDTCAMTF
ncbi:hypothetical protein PsYK624_033890 [Phanerochaete sordida]|uniref:Uncharacterized protein n=1 Tax=Phanerochaete sordida TaxID=48140 RepID=A0A9P3G2Y6_9APHY|nr:hypothetical protein PsYK624_033890 [Phanerochaete sordida]